MVIKIKYPSSPTDAYLNGLIRQIKIKSAKGVGVCVHVCVYVCVRACACSMGMSFG